MKEETKKGIIAKKSFSSPNLSKVVENGTKKNYYFYQLDSENEFTEGTIVEYTLITFNDGNPPIVIDVKIPA